MKLTLICFISCVLCLTSHISFAQKKTIKSTKQDYIIGTFSAKFSDSSEVVIDYNLDEKMASFTYLNPIPAHLLNIKSLTLKLAFTDKESNAPATYAEVLDKDISSILFYDDKIEIKFRNGNFSTYSNFQTNDKNAKTKTIK